MDSNTLRESVESLQNILIARATGGTADDAGYRALREELIGEPSLRDRLPSFVRSSRDLSQLSLELALLRRKHFVAVQ